MSAPRPLSEAINDETLCSITGHLDSLSFWQEVRDRAAVVLVGSCAAGLSDEFSDVDIDLLVEDDDFHRLYPLVWQAVDEGEIRILNPRARLFDEFPMVYIPGVHGHYQVKLAAEIEERIRAMDDVTRWIYANSIPISDPAGLQARLSELASTYPTDVLREKRRRHWFEAKRSYYGIKTQLPRGHLESLQLLCAQSVAHLLKYCCLCDGRPFPHDKWLYQVGVETSLGRQIRGYLDRILAELRRDHVVYEVPDAYVDPGDRNEALESYRLYHVFLHL